MQSDLKFYFRELFNRIIGGLCLSRWHLSVLADAQLQYLLKIKIKIDSGISS